MTAHKAQGQTMSRVILDLATCHSTKSPYVMVSRATTLAGMLILRPFEKKKITCRQSQETRDEMLRLEGLCLNTILNVGNSQERVRATLQLSQLSLKPIDYQSIIERAIAGEEDHNSALHRYQSGGKELTDVSKGSRKRKSMSSTSNSTRSTKKRKT